MNNGLGNYLIRRSDFTGGKAKLREGTIPAPNRGDKKKGVKKTGRIYKGEREGVLAPQAHPRGKDRDKRRTTTYSLKRDIFRSELRGASRLVSTGKNRGRSPLGYQELVLKRELVYSE